MFASSLWALDALVRTGLTATIPPASIVFFEHIFGLLVLIPVLVGSVAAYKKLRFSDWTVAAVLALVSGVGGTTLFTMALGKSFATGDFVTPVLLQKTQPIFVTILAALFLRERISARFLLLVPIALIGSYMVSFGVSPVELQLSGKELVFLLALGASLAWGSGTILSKTLLRKLTFAQATAIRFLLTIPIAFVASIFLNQTYSPILLTSNQVGRFVIIALTTGGVSTLIYYAGLIRTEAKISTFAELMFPIVSVVIAVTPLNPYGAPQALSLANIFGIVILLVAISLMSWENLGGSRSRMAAGTIAGRIVTGHGDGKRLGFPTANIALAVPLVLPYGVYACRVMLEGKKYKGVLHWGPRIIFGETTPQCEVYIFDFAKNIYGREIEVEIIGFIRPSKNFSSPSRMVSQIRKDCIDARKLLR
ncbi:EamA family transporter [Candidatus Gottesmanbacteria bacterium]|nr:EamA family transporter [Candidatus Gottesmanbacteria bacterium]